MAIKITKEGGKTKIELDNGHAEALAKITSDFEIENDEKTVGFILSVMKDAEGKAVETTNGSFVPADSIKKQKPENATTGESK